MTAQAKALQKFRQTYPRVDWYPDVESHKAIQRCRQANPGKSTRVIIDMLVTAGAKALFPTGDTLSGNS